MPGLTDSLDNALLGQIIEFSRKICIVVIIIITSNKSIEKPQDYKSPKFLSGFCFHKG